MIKNLGKMFDSLSPIVNKVLNPNINKTPIKPTKIEINFIKVKLSSLVKIGANIKVNIGATERSKAAVLD